MFPVLLSLGPITITSYGVLAVVAFFGGAFVIWKKGREEHLEEAELFDVTLLATFWGLVGARAWHIAWHWQDFGLDPLKWVTLVRNPGLGVMGAMLAGTAAVVLFAKSKKWQMFEVLDVIALGVAWAQMALFLAAFFNGSGYGVRTGLPLGVNFPGVEGARHPTQLYGLVLSGGLFWLLLKIFAQYRTYEWYRAKSGEAATGLTTSIFVAGFGMISLATSLLKPMDKEAGWGLGLVMVGVILGYVRSDRKLSEDIRRITNWAKGWRLPKTKEREKIRRKRKRGIVAGRDVI